MSRIFGIITIVIGGIIVADILTHPAGTAAASQGISGISKPAFNALLGQSSK
jgi:hypothetical protein